MLYFILIWHIYCSNIWGQHGNPNKNQIQIIQNTALRTLNFSNLRTETSPLYTERKILQLNNQIELQNLLYSNASLRNENPSLLNNTFKFRGELNPHYIRNPLTLNENNYRTRIYGLNSIEAQCIITWKQIRGC